ncbi:MAG: response regulator [Gammaproteobacteria bacterium]|nr:response regulator [Gammaproteobacteria bacterium]
MTQAIIVDDEPAMRSLLEEALTEAGHEVMATESVEEAVKQFRCKPESVMITDLVMPGKNGIDLIMSLRQEYPQAKIIAISGGGGIKGKFDYLEIANLIGADSIMKKPIDINELVRKVGNL